MKQFPTNITQRHQTYKQWKVDYDPTSDECIARGRTHRLLLKVTGLVEYTKRGSSCHDAILRTIKTGKDHPSKYMYTNIPAMRKLMMKVLVKHGDIFDMHKYLSNRMFFDKAASQTQ